ncbi:sensor histidine kinase [Nocardia sp. NPDC051570]|uniref:sensor histidine kinase n=1 Tax=Nocardia sp. NPDC051570 TaxID=3364324 RepID=UPI003790C88E
MTDLARLQRYRTALFLAPIPFAALDIWLLPSTPSNGIEHVAAAAGLVALLWRRKFPVIVFLCALPSTWSSVILPATALYSVGRYSRPSVTVALCTAILAGVLVAVRHSIAWDHITFELFRTIVATRLLAAMAPAVLGRLIRSRIALQAKIIEVTRAREEGETLRIQTALARDRAQLASEMHDVVSHQVSLIAVRAGALEMTSREPDTVAAAVTIRELSAATLDELRHMVTVLRASGTDATTLTPQPTIAELPQLIRDSGIDVTAVGALPDDLCAVTQRAIYRTVQEALTNVRKYAPGAQVTLQLGTTPLEVTVTITNTPGNQPRITLPSSGHGLRGLAERAELLDGSLTTHHRPDGGFGIELRLPRTADT